MVARVARIALGFALIIGGLFMLVLPGPGIITIIAGLAILSKDMAWAGRLADWAKTRFGRFAGEDAEMLTRQNEADPV